MKTKLSFFSEKKKKKKKLLIKASGKGLQSNEWKIISWVE